MDNKDIKTSIFMNIMIIVFTIFATFIMFTGIKFMHGYEIILESTKLGVFKFFTVQSNILIAIVSFIFLKNEIDILKGKKKEITTRNYILKLIGTTSVGLTFFIVFAYLGPISKEGIMSMLMNSNLFFHLIIPVMSIMTFVLFEKTNKISFKNTFYGLIPTAMYGFYYLINVLIHMENGKVSPIYDFYWFVQNGVWTAFIVVPIIFIITYLISLSMWKLNRK
jgi:hypothetical protein